ncbi:response regulator transcription factor [Streptomyces scopuliridis]|uniref:Response regulator transcription factor n=1 Tax=Streptomyces scopuliridis TaxID=452529 RepID=A0ACD4ZUA2_9ACTN|nr:response regulator transcription factor [Streptomyces scopuliridis]WSC01810.1 response regulator transcription factor [Streptomyces scopuliridis]WSC04653.1 response regulator transcription factor [Streptomyces scopuliridis]
MSLTRSGPSMYGMYGICGVNEMRGVGERLGVNEARGVSETLGANEARGSIGETPSAVRGDGQHVLIVVADQDISELLTTTLELAGYRVATARTGAEGLARIAGYRYDLVVVDATMPDLKGLARGRVPAADRPPVLFLTVCEYLDSLLPELGPGQEDYVTMPFRIAEVLARARVLLRGRGRGRGSAPVRRGPCYGDLVLNDATCQAWRGPRALDLTPAEYRLLRHLLVNADQVLSKEQICRHVWGDGRADNAIEKLISRLRQKVDQGEPPLIHTRRGFGYLLGR